MTALELVDVALAGANVVLALVLGSVYWRNHREIKSPFTLGLLLFAVFLVVHNALTVYRYATMMGMGLIGTPSSLLEGLLQAAAVVALLVATWR